MLNMWSGVNPTAPSLCHEDVPREAACETLPQLTPITEDHIQSRACSLPLLLVPSSHHIYVPWPGQGPLPQKHRKETAQAWTWFMQVSHVCLWTLATHTWTGQQQQLTAKNQLIEHTADVMDLVSTLTWEVTAEPSSSAPSITSLSAQLPSTRDTHSHGQWDRRQQLHVTGDQPGAHVPAVWLAPWPADRMLHSRRPRRRS